MTLPELSIKRPVFATVMSLVLVLVGLVAYDRLSVREYPAIDPPVVTVETSYPGASAAIVETQVTKVLEDTLSGIEGIDFITSVSRQESSQITIRFQLRSARPTPSRSCTWLFSAIAIRRSRSPTTPTAT